MSTHEDERRHERMGDERRTRRSGRAQRREATMLRDRVVVVTGASSGIGRAVVLRAARSGARVVLAARREEQLRVTARLCAEAAGARLAEFDDPTSSIARWMQCDVSRKEEVRALATSIAETEGACHLLVVNAGVSTRQPFDGPEAVGEVERVIATNLLGTAYLLPLLRAGAPAAIVGVSSVAGLVDPPSTPAYSASKAGMSMLLGSLRPVLRETGVHVACVHPGPLPTPGFPQERLMRSRLGRALCTDVDHVAAVVLRAAARRGSPDPVVPAFWRGLPLLRLLAPPLWRHLQRTAVRGLARGADA